jgi:hypothetical protein
MKMLRICAADRTFFSISGTGKIGYPLGIHMQKNEAKPHLLPVTKIQNGLKS